MIVLHSIVWLYCMLYMFLFMIHKIPSFFLRQLTNLKELKIQSFCGP